MSEDPKDGYKNAGLLPRAGAYLIDWLVVVLTGGLFAIIVGVIFRVIVFYGSHRVGLLNVLSEPLGLLPELGVLIGFGWSTAIPVLGPLYVLVRGISISPDLIPGRTELDVSFNIIYFLLMCLGPILFDSTYHALMESSVRQATIGKIMFRLRVTDLDGKRLSRRHAYRRYFAKVFSSLPLCLGYIAIALSKDKQGFHDKIAQTYVVQLPKDTQ